MFFSKLVAVPLAAAATVSSLGFVLPALDAQPIIDSGHIDVFHARQSSSGGLQLVSADDSDSSGRVYRELGSYVLKVKADRYYAASQMEQLAKQAPEGGWLLPIVQENNSLWPGWDTQGLKDSKYKAVDIVFTQINTPRDGKAMLFGAYSPFSLSIDKYLREPSGQFAEDYTLVNGSFIRDSFLSHTHVNWLFTKPGDYEMKVKLCDATDLPLADAGTAANTARNCSPEYTLNWQVVGNNKPDENKPADSKPNENKAVGTSEADQNTGNENKNANKQDANDQDANKQDIDGLTAENDNFGNAGSLSNGQAGSLGATQAGSQNGGQGALAKVEGQKCMLRKVGTLPRLKAEGGRVASAPSAGTRRVSSSISHVIPANTHVHPRWLFTAPGRYHLQLSQSLTLADGRTVSTLTPITVQVGGSGNVNEGHYDIGAKLVNGRLVSSLKNPDGQEVDPAGVVFGLGAGAKVNIPAAYGQLLPVNSVAWEIPQVQKPGVPWVGGNSMDPSLRQGAKGALTWRLHSVSGPGRVIIMQDQGSFNPKPVVWLDSASGQVQPTNSVERPTVSASPVYDTSVLRPGQVQRGGDIMQWQDSEGRACTPTAQEMAEGGLDSGFDGASASYSQLAETGVGMRPWSLLGFGGGIALLGLGIVRVTGLRRKLL